MSRGEPVLVNITAIKHADDKEKLVLPGTRMRFLIEKKRKRENCIIHNSFPANVSVTRECSGKSNCWACRENLALPTLYYSTMSLTFTEYERVLVFGRVVVFPIETLVGSLMRMREYFRMKNIIFFFRLFQLSYILRCIRACVTHILFTYISYYANNLYLRLYIMRNRAKFSSVFRLNKSQIQLGLVWKFRHVNSIN